MQHNQWPQPWAKALIKNSRFDVFELVLRCRRRRCDALATRRIPTGSTSAGSRSCRRTRTDDGSGATHVCRNTPSNAAAAASGLQLTVRADIPRHVFSIQEPPISLRPLQQQLPLPLLPLHRSTFFRGSAGSTPEFVCAVTRAAHQQPDSARRNRYHRSQNVAGDPGAASTSIPPLRDEPPPTRSAELSGVVANLTTRTRVDRPGSGRGEAASQAVLSRAVRTAGRGQE